MSLLTEALHHHGYAVSTGPQVPHSLFRVLTTDLPPGRGLQGTELTGVGLRVVVCGCYGGDGVILMDSAAPIGRWCWAR
jgi:hypothetical protein